jgi:hypothetical protein
MKTPYFILRAILLGVGALAAVRADTNEAVATTTPFSQWTLSTGFDYTTGKYGQPSSTDILTIPVIGRYDYDLWTFKLIVPWTHVSGPADVVQDVGLLRNGAARPTRQTESGLGDVVATATRNVLNESHAVSLDLTGKIKFGTANRNQGLGTGENDYSLQADVYKVIEDFTPFVTLGYRILGSPPGLSLNNVWFASGGATYRISAPTAVGAALDLQERSSDTVENVSELTAFITHELDRQWKLQGYVLTGFTHSSPDFGLGGIVSRAF